MKHRVIGMFFNGINNDNPLVNSEGGFFCCFSVSKDDVQGKGSQANAISV